MFLAAAAVLGVEAFSLIFNGYQNTGLKRRFNKQNIISNQDTAQAIIKTANTLSDLSSFRAARAGLSASKEVGNARAMDLQTKELALLNQNDQAHKLARDNFSANLDSELLRQMIGGIGATVKQGVNDYSQYQLAKTARNSDTTIPVPGVTQTGRKYASQNKIIENGSSQYLVNTLQDEMYNYLDPNTDFGAM